MDNWITFFSWLFLATNVGRIFAYGPQIRAALRCPHGAQSISRLTWGYFALSHASVSTYGFVVLHDVSMGVVFMGNCIACCALVLIVTLRKSGRRLWWERAVHLPAARVESAPGSTSGACLLHWQVACMRRWASVPDTLKALHRLGRPRAYCAMLAVVPLLATTSIADGNPDVNATQYEYSAGEVIAAATADLSAAMAPFERTGQLNRDSPQLDRLRGTLALMRSAATRRYDVRREPDWGVYLHDSRLREAYSRANGKLVLSNRFIERYLPGDEELAFVIGHEMAHVLCEHERTNLSAVWRMNAPYRLPARYAMEYLDTEPVVRDHVAPLARLQEHVADRIGLELVRVAGLDAGRALDFFDKVGDGETGLFPDVHDLPSMRKTALRAAIHAGPNPTAANRSLQSACQP